MKVFDEAGKLSSTPFTGEDVLRSGIELKRPAASKATSTKADFSTTFTNLLKAGGDALQSLDSGDIVADERSARRHSAASPSATTSSSTLPAITGSAYFINVTNRL